MAQFGIVVGGIQIGLIDTNDRGSKDPGPNSFPQAAPNVPATTGAPSTKQLTFGNVNGSNQIINSISDPG